MKFGSRNNIPEKESLKNILHSYRQTPHPATGLPPASMMFRDGYRGEFPRQSVTDEDIPRAKARDFQQKQANEDRINSSKYRQSSNFKVGDKVYMRNYNKQKKFNQFF